MRNENVKYLRQFYTKSGINIALSSAADAATLRALLDQLKIAERAREDSMNALKDAEDKVPSYEDRLAALPVDQRQAVGKIYQMFMKAKDDYVNADTVAKMRGAETRIDNAEKALEKALPPIDESKIKAGHDLVEQRSQETVEQAWDGIR